MSPAEPDFISAVSSFRRILLEKDRIIDKLEKDITFLKRNSVSSENYENVINHLFEENAFLRNKLVSLRSELNNN
jgi:hypothetical protein